MKIEKKFGCGHMWMDSGAGKKRPAGESKGQQAAIVNILLGRASSPFFPSQSFLYTARKTNYQETLNSREREKLESAQDQCCRRKKRERKETYRS
jgi:hypothetical protein